MARNFANVILKFSFPPALLCVTGFFCPSDRLGGNSLASTAVEEATLCSLSIIDMENTSFQHWLRMRDFDTNQGRNKCESRSNSPRPANNSSSYTGKQQTNLRNAYFENIYTALSYTFYPYDASKNIISFCGDHKTWTEILPGKSISSLCPTLMSLHGMVKLARKEISRQCGTFLTWKFTEKVALFVEGAR